MEGVKLCYCQFVFQLRPTLERTRSDIPADALEDTSRLTTENISYLKNILSQKLNKTVVDVTPRGGDEVAVIFSDNKSRIVRLANENTPKDLSISTSGVKTTIPVTTCYDASPLAAPTPTFSAGLPQFGEIPKAKLLRTVSATHYGQSLHDPLRSHSVSP